MSGPVCSAMRLAALSLSALWFACATAQPTWRKLVAPSKPPLDEGAAANACAAMRGLSLGVSQRGGGNVALFKATEDLLSEFQAGKLPPSEAATRAAELTPTATASLRVEIRDELNGLFRLKGVELAIDGVSLLDERGQLGCPLSAARILDARITPGRHALMGGFTYVGTAGYLKAYTWRLKDRIDVDVPEGSTVVVRIIAREDRVTSPEVAEEWPTIRFGVEPESSRLTPPR